MPEMTFHVQWPDGSTEDCYSPSHIIKDYFVPGQSYPLDDFVARANEALNIANERVNEKYGFFCAAALRQMASINETSGRFKGSPGVEVLVQKFEER